MTDMAAGMDRRTLLLGSTATAALVTLLGLPRPARAQMVANGWEELLATLTRDSKPTEAALTFDVPEIAENGNTVPFKAAVESPMTPADHVRAVHIIATGNPIPLVASFKFTPMSGKAVVTGRMRLAHTQDMIMVAEFGTGAFAMARQSVKVTVGGCGG